MAAAMCCGGGSSPNGKKEAKKGGGRDQDKITPRTCPCDLLPPAKFHLKFTKLPKTALPFVDETPNM
jgi:hypothetical protein